jgi:hypothetical protein
MKPVDFSSFFDGENARFAVFSTYEFDPVHFERYLLGSKALAQARRIIVMVDANRFQKLLTENKTPARSLNQRYLVLPVRKPGGVFHPKLALLLGEKHADVICGSNNLTQSGSTHNLELLNRIPLQIDAEQRQIAHLPLIHQAIQFFKDCTAHGETRAGKIARRWLDELAQEFPWINSLHKNSNGDSDPILVHTLYGGLWDWVSERIGKARPRKIHVISPFYDSDLSLLKRFRERWPDCPVEITAQQNTSNLPANLLSRFGKGIRLFDLPSVDNRRLHAKLMAVSLNGKSLCLAGSANFTEAAFDGGNVETCLAWEVDGDVVKSLFEDEFSRKPISASEFEPGREQPPAEDASSEPPMRVKSCVLDESGRLSLTYSISPEIKPDRAAVAFKHFNEREPVFTKDVKVTASGFEEFMLPPEVNAGFNGAVLCYLVAAKGEKLQVSVPMWLIQEHKLTHEMSEGGGNSGREAEVRETGRGLVEHLDEVGSQQGRAQLIQYLMNLNIHYRDDSQGHGGGHSFRVKIRDPFHSDTIPDWLKLSREQFPDLEQAIYSFADRHRDSVLCRHERKANVNGLSNFVDVMVATSKVLFVYLRREVLIQHQVTFRLREYLNIFTGKFPEDPEEEITGYLARIYSNRKGSPGQLKKTFEEHNVSGHLRALLLIAQVVRGSADGSDTSKARCQLPMLVDQINAFENRIGLGRATAMQIGRALEDYEMLTEQELALWTKDLK